MRFGRRGQTGAVLGIIMAVVLLLITAVILENMYDALLGSVATAWSPTFANVTTNAKNGLNLATLTPLLLGAGALIGAVYLFAKSR